MGDDENINENNEEQVQDIVEDTDADTRDVADIVRDYFDRLTDRINELESSIANVVSENMSKMAGISVQNGAVIRDYGDDIEDTEDEILDIDNMDLTV